MGEPLSPWGTEVVEMHVPPSKGAEADTGEQNTGKLSQNS